MKTRYLTCLLAATLAFGVAGSAAYASDWDKPEWKTSIHADLHALSDLGLKAHGLMRSDEWWLSQGSVMQDYSVTVEVAIPGKLSAFQSYEAAMDADVWVQLANRDGAYAECQLVVQPLIWQRPVSYTMRLLAENDAVKPLTGICDVDLAAKGIQVGIPVVGFKDVLTVFVREDVPATKTEFLKGFCE